jgi:hypothetical protein
MSNTDIDKSKKLAMLWASLQSIQREIQETAIPLGTYLGIDDPELMIAIETLDSRITEHFKRFRLVAETRREGVSNR